MGQGLKRSCCREIPPFAKRFKTLLYQDFFFLVFLNNPPFFFVCGDFFFPGGFSHFFFFVQTPNLKPDSLKKKTSYYDLEVGLFFH